MRARARMPLRALARLMLLAALALGAGTLAQAAPCAPDRADLRGPWGQLSLTVEVAATPEARARGLMFRKELPASQGMLFVYERPGAPAFWMKNTLIPLDMLFITPEGRVKAVVSRAQPGDLTPRSGGDGVQYVLEIQGGLAQRLGIGPGSELRHPALDQSRAAWPCAGAD